MVIFIVIFVAVVVIVVIDVSIIIIGVRVFGVLCLELVRYTASYTRMLKF